MRLSRRYLRVATFSLIIGLCSSGLSAQQRPRPTGDPDEDTPPTPPPSEGAPSPSPGGPDFTVRGPVRLTWDQPTDEHAIAAGYRYRLSVGGEEQPLDGVECAPEPGPDGFECQVPLPLLPGGDHVLRVTAIEADGVVQGAPSAPITVRVELPTDDPGQSDMRGPGVEAGAATLAVGLDDPTDLAILPDGRVLIAERAGRFRLYQPDGSLVTALAAMPELLTGDGRGLLSVVVDRDFVTTRAVFAAYSADEGLRLARFTVAGDALVAHAVILEGLPHAAARPSAVLRMGPDRKLYLALDDGGEASRAADRGDPAGKVLRFNQDGTTPEDRVAGWPVLVEGLHGPKGLAWTAAPEAVWVVDVTAHGAPRLLRVAASPPTGVHSVTLDSAFRPSGLATAADGALLMSNAAPSRMLLRVRPSATAVADTSDAARAQRHDIRALAVAADGSVYACTARALLRIDVTSR